MCVVIHHPSRGATSLGRWREMSRQRHVMADPCVVVCSLSDFHRVAFLVSPLMLRTRRGKTTARRPSRVRVLLRVLLASSFFSLEYFETLLFRLLLQPVSWQILVFILFDSSSAIYRCLYFRETTDKINACTSGYTTLRQRLPAKIPKWPAPATSK